MKPRRAPGFQSVVASHDPSAGIEKRNVNREAHEKRVNRVAGLNPQAFILTQPSAPKQPDETRTERVRALDPTCDGFVAFDVDEVPHPFHPTRSAAACATISAHAMPHDDAPTLRNYPLSPLDPPLEVVLVSPEIPPNTGNVARLCACTGSRLHLVAPLGFSLADKDLRRAGLDYWADVHVATWGSFEEFEEAFELAGKGRRRVHFFTARARTRHVEAGFQAGDVLVFGCESRGLPPDVLLRYADRTVALPMIEGRRSLNLSATVAVGVYEAMRQAEGPAGGCSL